MVTTNPATDVAPVASHQRPPLDLEWVVPGMATYLASFFLPAVGGGSRWIPGWDCARTTLILAFGKFDSLSLNLLGMGLGLVNPLVLLYFASWAFHAGERVRFGIAMAATALIPLSWRFIAAIHLAVGIGHVLWVGGLLLMLLPELVWFFRGGRP
jgi:hypothetical protein